MDCSAKCMLRSNYLVITMPIVPIPPEQQEELRVFQCEERVCVPVGTELIALHAHGDMNGLKSYSIYPDKIIATVDMDIDLSDKVENYKRGDFYGWFKMCSRMNDIGIHGPYIKGFYGFHNSYCGFGQCPEGFTLNLALLRPSDLPSLPGYDIEYTKYEGEHPIAKPLLQRWFGRDDVSDARITMWESTGKLFHIKILPNGFHIECVERLNCFDALCEQAETLFRYSALNDKGESMNMRLLVDAEDMETQQAHGEWIKTSITTGKEQIKT